MANRAPLADTSSPLTPGGSSDWGSPGPSGERSIGTAPGESRKGTPPRVSPHVSSSSGSGAVPLGNTSARNLREGDYSSARNKNIQQAASMPKREYYDPATICDQVGPNAVAWFLTRRCTNMRGKSILFVAKLALLTVAFLTSIAQWSVLASGVAFFTRHAGLAGYEASGVTSAAFSVCFLCCILGGSFSDGAWGSIKVLTVGLTGASISALILTGLCYPADILRESIATKIIITVSVFSFAAFLGFSLTALTTMIGDQCHNRPSQLSSMYNLYYAVIQFGAFSARAFFPLVNWELDWMYGNIFFVLLPCLAALLFFRTHVNIFTTKKPVERSPVALAFRILFRRALGTSKEELSIYHGEKMVRDAFRAARVLRIHCTLPVFWALYFQMFGLWYLQAKQMDLTVFSDQQVLAEQVTVVNPLFDVMCLGIFGGVFALVKKCCKATLPPTWKMMFGYMFALGAFGLATVMQYRIENKPPNTVSIYWQLPQFFLICAAEILVYPPALHLAYVNSPSSMRGFVQSVLWFFIGLGNLLNTILIFITSTATGSTGSTSLHENKMPFFFLYLGIMVLATIIYAVLFYFYDEHPADAESHATHPVTAPPLGATSASGQNPTPRLGTTTGNTTGSQMVTVPNRYTTPKNSGLDGGGDLSSNSPSPQHPSPQRGYGGVIMNSQNSSSSSPARGAAPHYSSPTSGAYDSGSILDSANYSTTGGQENQPLLLDATPSRMARRTGSGLSDTEGGTPSPYAYKKVRRVPSPRDPRLGGAQYYSTRRGNTPRTSGLDPAVAGGASGTSSVGGQHHSNSFNQPQDLAKYY